MARSVRARLHVDIAILYALALDGPGWARSLDSHEKQAKKHHHPARRRGASRRLGVLHLSTRQEDPPRPRPAGRPRDRLQGGAAQRARSPPATSSTRRIGIINRRVNGLGVTESAVQTQGADQISVALPGVKNVDQAIRTVGQTAQLQFFNDGRRSVWPAQPTASPQRSSRRRPPRRSPDGRRQGASSTSWLGARPSTKYLAVVAPPGQGRQATRRPSTSSTSCRRP